MKLLANQWALVTGSSRGIGQQIALGLAERKCNVVVHGRTLENTVTTMRLLEPYGVQTLAVYGDLGTPEGIERAIAGVRQGPGHVDILYNNAAIIGTSQSIYVVKPEEWLRIFQVNVFAMIAICNAFVPEMKRRGYGRVINLTSGIRDQPELAPYSVSKAAVDKYSRDLAFDVRGSGVLVNYLDPGWLKTDMGGPNAQHPVETVLPGALVPALLEADGANGQFFAAQDYRGQVIL